MRKGVGPDGMTELIPERVCRTARKVGSCYY